MDNSKPQSSGADHFAASFQRTLAALAAAGGSSQPSTLPNGFPRFPTHSAPPMQQPGGSMQPQGMSTHGLAPVLAGIAPPSLLDGISNPTGPSNSAFRPNPRSGMQPYSSAYSAPSYHPAMAAHQRMNQLNMDEQSKALTVELSHRLPSLLNAAVQLQSQWPGMLPDAFQRHLENLVGPLPGGVKLPTTMPPEVYELIKGYPNAGPAYAMLQRVLASIPANKAPYSTTAGASRGSGQASQQQKARPTKQAKPKTQKASIPESVPIICNGQTGMFWVENQVITCNCDKCRDAAAKANLSQLAMSPGEFERHCGLPGSRKWKLTIRVNDKYSSMHNQVIGKWLERHRIEPLAHKPIGLVRVLVPDESGKQVLVTTKQKKKNIDIFDTPNETEGVTEDGVTKNKTITKKRKKEAGEEKSYVPSLPRSYSAAGKNRWLVSPTKNPNIDSEGHVDVRLGDDYQATVPETVLPRPSSIPDSQKRKLGQPGPSVYHALASAQGPELQQAQTLPRDALRDVWLGGAGEHHRARANQTTQGDDVANNTKADVSVDASGGGGENGGGRKSRQRKPPQWMANTMDPNEALGGKPMLSLSFPDMGRASEGVGDDYNNTNNHTAHPPPKRHKPDLNTTLMLAIEAGLQPEISKWNVNDEGQLQLSVKLGGTTFKGALPAVSNSGQQQRQRPPVPLPPPASHKKQQQSYGGGGGHKPAPMRYPSPADLLLSAAAASSGADDEYDTGALDRQMSTEPKPKRAYTRGGAPMPPEKQARLEERRQQAEIDYQRLLQQGAPPGTKCALCHGTRTDEVPEDGMGPGGRSAVGLGEFRLVRVSVMTNTWVHDQCARWSPEVFDPTGDDELEGIPECIRRGRLIRCRVCNDKGATLGCLKPTCKHSFHLPCARRYGCLLNIDPYIVACPEHVDKLPPTLMRAIKAVKPKSMHNNRVKRAATPEPSPEPEESSPPVPAAGESTEEAPRLIDVGDDYMVYVSGDDSE